MAEAPDASCVFYVGETPLPGLVAALERHAVGLEVARWSEVTGPPPSAAVVLADLRSNPSEAEAALKAWRTSDARVPVVAIVDGRDDHVRALEAGADDFVDADDDVESTCRRVLARSGGGQRRTVSRLQLNDGVIELDRQRVVRGDEEHRLTAMEHKLLSFLARHPGTAFTKEQLQAQVWGYRKGVRSRTVISTVQRVRQKIEVSPREPEHLLTVDEGYVLRPAAGRERPRERPAQRSLPVASTPFIGRVREQRELLAVVREEGQRLTTLLGPGGMGKTRLALRVAERAASAFADVVFVEAAPLKDARAVVENVASVFGVAPGDGMRERLLSALTDWDGLLILDNLEHIEDAASEVAALLAAGPGVRILVTSRTPLALTAERLWRLEGLARTPADGGDDVLTSEAGALWLDVATRAAPGFSPASDAERAAVARIIDEVEGMPLALVLSASWTRALSPSDILAELASTIDTLAGDLKDLPERHRSIRATIEGSLKLLSDDDEETLAALSVFEAPFTLASARVVTGAGVRVLLSLCDTSLLNRGSTGRFSLHPLVRRVVRDRLASRPEAERALLRRHRDHWAGTVRELMAGFDALMMRGQPPVGEDEDLQDHLAALDYTLALAAGDELVLDDVPSWALMLYLRWETDFERVTQHYLRWLNTVRALPPSPRRDAVLLVLTARRFVTAVALGEADTVLALKDEIPRLLVSELVDDGGLCRILGHLAIAHTAWGLGLGQQGAAAADAVIELSARSPFKTLGMVARGARVLNLGLLSAPGLSDILDALMASVPPSVSLPFKRNHLTAGFAAYVAGDYRRAAACFEVVHDLLGPEDGAFAGAALAFGAAARWRCQSPGSHDLLRAALEEVVLHRAAPGMMLRALPDALMLLVDDEATPRAVLEQCAQLLAWADAWPGDLAAATSTLRSALEERGVTLKPASRHVDLYGVVVELLDALSDDAP